MSYNLTKHQVIIFRTFAAHVLDKDISEAHKEEVLAKLTEASFLKFGTGFAGFPQSYGNPAGLHKSLLEKQGKHGSCRAPIFILLEKSGDYGRLGITLADERAYALRRYDDANARSTEITRFFALKNDRSAHISTKAQLFNTNEADFAKVEFNFPTIGTPFLLLRHYNERFQKNGNGAGLGFKRILAEMIKDINVRLSFKINGSDLGATHDSPRIMGGISDSFESAVRNVIINSATQGGKPLTAEAVLGLGPAGFKKLLKTGAVAAFFGARHSNLLTVQEYALRKPFFDLISGTDLAQELNIKYVDVIDYWGKNLRVSSKYDEVDFCKKEFAELLKIKYGKPIEKISKKEILKIDNRDFFDCKKQDGSSFVGMRFYFSNIFRAEGMVMPVLSLEISSRLGYLSASDLTENEIRLRSAPPSGPSNKYASLSYRKKAFDAYLKTRFNKPPGEVTKDELLKVSFRQMQSAVIPSYGKLRGLIAYYQKYGKMSDGPVYYRLLNDLGYAKKLSIACADVVEAASQKNHVPANPISEKSVRLDVFNAYLKENFNKTIETVTYSEICSISIKKFRSYRLKTYRVASPYSLLEYFAKDCEGKFSRHAAFHRALVENGIAERLDIGLDALQDAAKKRRSSQSNKASLRSNRKKSLQYFFDQHFKGKTPSFEDLTSIRAEHLLKYDKKIEGGILTPARLVIYYRNINKKAMDRGWEYKPPVYLMLADLCHTKGLLPDYFESRNSFRQHMKVDTREKRFAVFCEIFKSKTGVEFTDEIDHNLMRSTLKCMVRNDLKPGDSVGLYSHYREKQVLWAREQGGAPADATQVKSCGRSVIYFVLEDFGLIEKYSLAPEDLFHKKSNQKLGLANSPLAIMSRQEQAKASSIIQTQRAKPVENNSGSANYRVAVKLAQSNKTSNASDLSPNLKNIGKN